MAQSFYFIKRFAKITRLFVLAVFLLSRYVEGLFVFSVINPEKLPFSVPEAGSRELKQQR